MQISNFPANWMRGIVDALAALVLAAGWMFNYKAPPWANFYHEVYVAIGFVFLLSAFTFLGSLSKIKLSVAIILPLACLIALFFQSWFGLVFWWGDIVVAAIYLLGITLAILFAKNLVGHQRRRLIHILALSLLLAGIGTALLQFFQLTGLYVDWVRGTDLNRPSANIGQPNHVGTLGLLALISVYLLHKDALVSKYALIGASALLLLSIALTGSRAAVVGIVVLAIFRYLVDLRLKRPSPNWHFLLLVCGLAASYLLVWIFRLFYPVLAAGYLGLNPPLIRLDSSLRIEAWLMLLAQVWAAPWFGYGWGQTGLAHLLADRYVSPFGAHFQNAHNIFLDLLLWFGLPLGLCVSAALMWVVTKALRFYTEARLFASGGLIVLLCHSLFEHPLFYGYFLAYFCVFLGLNSPVFTVGKLSRREILPWLVAATASFSLMLVLMVRDHQILEKLFVRWGIASFVSAKNFEYEPPSLIFLTHYEKLLKYSYRGEAPFDVGSKLEEMEQVVQRFPTINIIFNYAVVLGHLERWDEARQWLQRGCAIHTQKQCNELKVRWQDAWHQVDGARPYVEWPTTVFDGRTQNN